MFLTVKDNLQSNLRMRGKCCYAGFACKQYHNMDYMKYALNQMATKNMAAWEESVGKKGEKPMKLKGQSQESTCMSNSLLGDS